MSHATNTSVSRVYNKQMHTFHELCINILVVYDPVLITSQFSLDRQTLLFCDLGGITQY